MKMNFTYSTVIKQDLQTLRLFCNILINNMYQSFNFSEFSFTYTVVSASFSG